MQKLTLCFSILIFVLSQRLCAQDKRDAEITIVFKDFQKHADTTIIIQKKENGYPKPDYFILSKKDKQVNIYFYGDATRSITLPLGIKLVMKKLNFGGDKMKTHNNVLFYPLALTSNDASDFWRTVIAANPWHINDDFKNQRCSDSSIRIFDGPDLGLFLITKNEIKTLVFDSPDFYEQKCPGNEHRKAILKIQDTFKSYYKF